MRCVEEGVVGSVVGRASRGSGEISCRVSLFFCCLISTAGWCLCFLVECLSKSSVSFLISSFLLPLTTLMELSYDLDVLCKP